MHRRFLAKLIVVAGATALAGCAMVDHSNTMLFGTNTNVGLQVGTDASNVPSINVGYRRQEAVFLPLQSNYKDAASGRFIPCGSATAHADMAQECKFLGKNGDSKAEDSYSVLASFGAQFSAKTDTSQAEASGGLAQYFATGAAAQILALKGGAAVVAVSKAAEQSAATSSDSALVALVGGTAVSTEMTANEKKRAELADYLGPLDAAKFDTEAKRLSLTALGNAKFLQESYCKDEDQAGCVAKIRNKKFNEFIDEFYRAYKS